MAKKVLVLWHQACTPDTLQRVLSELRDEWAKQGAELMLEHVDRLKMAEYSVATFDHALLGVIPPSVHVHSNEVLEEVVRILKPLAGLTLRQPVNRGSSSHSSLCTVDQLMLSLRLAGFIDPIKTMEEVCPTQDSSTEEFRKAGITANDVTIVTIEAKKPSYEKGASSLLRLGGAINLPPSSSSASRSNVSSKEIWTLAANDILDDDLDLMDSDSLLRDEDLIRPDPASLRSNCGPDSGKRKACKNCTCGLADELDVPEQQSVKKLVTSSCGNCYLGDAFRCSSCPYLGMPAFKPGQEIKLSDRQLNADQ